MVEFSRKRCLPWAGNVIFCLPVDRRCGTAVQLVEENWTAACKGRSRDWQLFNERLSARMHTACVIMTLRDDLWVSLHIHISHLK